MKPLEEIARNPSAANITENLILAVDPFGYYSLGVPEDLLAMLENALRDKFKEGHELIDAFEQDILEANNGHFTPHIPVNSYDRLKLFFDTLPDYLKKRLSAIERSNRTHSKKIELTIEDEYCKLRTLAEYFVSWTKYNHPTRKSPIRDQQYEALKGVSSKGITVYLRENPNVGFPNYDIFGWQERTKIGDSIVRKIFSKTTKFVHDAKKGKKVIRITNIADLAKSGNDEAMRIMNQFYSPDNSFGSDYFGVRIFAVGARGRGNVVKWLMNLEDWDIVSFEDYSLSLKKEKGLMYCEAMLKYKKSDTTELLQVQIATLPHHLIGDFFSPHKHALYTVRKETGADEMIKAHPRLYARAQANVVPVLGFLNN